MESRAIRIYYHPNLEIRSYLTPEPVTRPLVETFKRPLREDLELVVTRLGTAGAHMVRDLMSLPGIEHIRVKPKEVRIKKNPASSWNELEPGVLKIMERAVQRSRMRVLRGAKK